MEWTAKRLRAARQEAGLTLRQLGAITGVSASLLSQIENGKARPSVTTLYALIAALGVSLDELAATENSRPEAVESTAGRLDDGLARLHATGGPVTQEVRHPGARPTLELESGVTWEQLTNSLTPFIDHLLVTYAPGGSSSSAAGRMTSHSGFEHLYMMQGQLTLKIDFETVILNPGDSMAFDSSRPHLFRNDSAIADAVGVWFVVGRHSPFVLRQITDEISNLRSQTRDA